MTNTAACLQSVTPCVIVLAATNTHIPSAICRHRDNVPWGGGGGWIRLLQMKCCQTADATERHLGPLSVPLQLYRHDGLIGGSSKVDASASLEASAIAWGAPIISKRIKFAPVFL